MPEYKSKEDYIFGTLDKIKKRHEAGGTNSIATCKNVESDMIAFLENMSHRGEINGINSHFITCNKVNNPPDRGNKITVEGIIFDGRIQHNFTFTLHFNTGPVDELINDTDVLVYPIKRSKERSVWYCPAGINRGKIEPSFEDNFNNAMKGV